MLQEAICKSGNGESGTGMSGIRVGTRGMGVGTRTFMASHTFNDLLLC